MQKLEYLKKLVSLDDQLNLTATINARGDLIIHSFDENARHRVIQQLGSVGAYFDVMFVSEEAQFNVHDFYEPNFVERYEQEWKNK